MGDSGELSTVEVYDSRLHQWAEAENLPMACTFMKSTVHEGNWYLMGGIGQGQEVFCASLDSLIASTRSERTGTSVWRRLPEVPHEWSSTATLGNCLISIGGESSDNSTLSSAIHAYSPSTRSWVYVGDIPDPCSLTCSVVLPTGDLMMMGGWTNGGCVDRVFRATIKG